MSDSKVKKDVKYFRNSRFEVVYTVSHTVENAICNIFLVGGINEYTGVYEEFIDFLNKNKLNVFQFDHCGFGYSSGERGYVNKRADWLEDFEIGLNRVNEVVGLPTVIISHSFGASLNFNFLGKNIASLSKWNIVGSINSASIFEIKAFKALQYIAKIIDLINPRWTPKKSVNEFKSMQDDERDASLLLDPLYYNGRLKARLGLSLLELSKENKKLYSKINIPILLMHAKEDPITDSNSIHQIYDALNNNKNKSKKIYDKTNHHCLTDFSKVDSWNDCLDFVKSLI